MLTEVTDQKRYYRAITKVNGFIKSINGNLHRKRNTCVWKLLVEWKKRSVYLVSINYSKKYNPVDMAEYSMANEISDEPAFIW